MNSIQQTLSDINNLLLGQFPDTVLTKGRDKAPAIAHKSKTIVELRAIYTKDFTKTNDGDVWGLLLGKDMVAIDFDDPQKYTQWSTKFPELLSCPLETTKKGHHCFFKNDSDYTNKTGIDQKVDFLAIERSGTRRYVVIAPSPDKSWVNPLATTPVKSMSDELKAFLVQIDSAAKRPKSSASGEQQSVKKGGDLLSLNVMRNILASIDPKNVQDNANWLRVIHAVKHQVPPGADKKMKDRYFNVVNEFCKGMDSYSEEENMSLFYSTAPYDGPKCGVGTWKHLVKEFSTNAKLMDKVDPINDKSAAEVYLSHYGDYHCMYQFERWDYDTRVGLWKCPSKGNRLIQMRYAQQLDELREYSEERRKIGDMLAMADANLQEVDLLNLIDTESLGKIQFADCVYDMVAQRRVDHSPSFYSTKAIGRKFKEREDIPQSAFDFVHRIMENNFDPDAEISAQKSDYFLRMIGYAMYGINKERRFLFGLGPSATGKGVLAELVTSAFGTYVITTDPSIYTKKDFSNSSAPKPEIRRLHAVRISWSQEMNMNKPIDGNNIKTYASGGDKTACRTLHKEEVEIRITCLHVCCAQDHPNIEPLDDAVKNRVRYLRFEQVFKKKTDPDYDPKVHKPVDDKLKDQIMENDDIKQAFFWVCMDAYQRYVSDGSLIDPPCVVDDTNKQFEDSQSWQTVFEEHFEITRNLGDVVSFKDIMETLGREGIKMSRAEVKRKLEKLMGIAVGRKHKMPGVKMRTFQSEMAEADF